MKNDINSTAKLPENRTINEENLGMRFDCFGTEKTFHLFCEEEIGELLAKNTARTAILAMIHKHCTYSFSVIMRYVNHVAHHVILVALYVVRVSREGGNLLLSSTVKLDQQHLLFGEYLQSWTTLYRLNLPINRQLKMNLTSMGVRVSMF